MVRLHIRLPTNFRVEHGKIVAYDGVELIVVPILPLTLKVCHGPPQDRMGDFNLN